MTADADGVDMSCPNPVVQDDEKSFVVKNADNGTGWPGNVPQILNCLKTNL